MSIDLGGQGRSRSQRWPTPGHWVQAAIVVATLLAGLVLLCLRTSNNWDEAPVCGAGESGRCVTELSGKVASRGTINCTVGQYASCSDLEVDLEFVDGSSRDLDLSQGDRITAVLAGGQRNAQVVPHSPAPVVGRFHGTHLVELVFPSVGSRLATDDYPGYAVNLAAQFALMLSPVGILVTMAVVGWRVQRGVAGEPSEP